MVDAYQLCGRNYEATNIYKQLEKTYNEYLIWEKSK